MTSSAESLAEKSELSVKCEGESTYKPFKSIKSCHRKIIKNSKGHFKVISTDSDYKKVEKYVEDVLKGLVGSFSLPSPIQAHCWPIISDNRDMIGIAETGSGKTITFVAPLLAKVVFSLYSEMISSKDKRNDKTVHHPNVLIIAPTRELAIQISKVIQEAIEKVKDLNVLHKCLKINLSTMCIYGGTNRSDQIREYKGKNPQVLVGTPGRLIDLVNSNIINLSKIHSWVLDEADRMLDMGFEPEIRQLATAMTNLSRQTIMFSATWPPSIQNIASRYLRPNSIRVTVFKQSEEPDHQNVMKASSSVKQIVDVVKEIDKNGCLLRLLKKYCHQKDTETPRIVIFVLYKKEAVRIENFCTQNGYKCVSLHGDMTQIAREKSYQSFKAGSSRILIATDVAARGLDIPSIEAVINYTFPLTIEDYIHRIGRTGRAGKLGTSHTLFTSNESHLAAALVAQLKAADQPVPEELIAFGGSTKRKTHSEYGAFYREMDASKKAKHTKFSSDEE